ncbi:PIP5K4 [Symbiodinium microadriaticum]|nr:PIP5K4 [Symbiodinium microadriaticum]
MWVSHLAHERSGTGRVGSPLQDRGLLRRVLRGSLPSCARLRLRWLDSQGFQPRLRTQAPLLRYRQYL